MLTIRCGPGQVKEYLNALTSTVFDHFITRGTYRKKNRKETIDLIYRSIEPRYSSRPKNDNTLGSWRIILIRLIVNTVVPCYYIPRCFTRQIDGKCLRFILKSA